ERLDVGAAARPGAGDDVGPAVAGQVARGDEHAAGEGPAVGEEALDAAAGGAAEHLDVRATARAGAGNDVGLAVAVHVAGGHGHAAAKQRVVGEERMDHGSRQAVEDLDVGAARGARAGDEVGEAVAVDVA